MKRFHVHVAVDDLNANIRFYSAVFGAEPSVRKPDYAKWMLEDPRINFAISQRGARAGLDHLGLQVDTDEELSALRSQVTTAEINRHEQADATCCYARSDKYWITDPQGIAWETYHTLGEAEIYGVDKAPKAGEAATCCAPPSKTVKAENRKAAAKCC
ncbi:glyoxalase/bleomycin resistance protein/dioxygenase superfamily protein [Nitrosospira multiformis]|uniref:Glyoxalase/bleomycin resistance protein/dioxygenase superfamily protein n=1 Tax=Nitrosospira multiformis TaxID=1231 RepID=A0A2T5HZS6_9PROT|nr:ArsI/CadI family heavy metal resistance metalloenzyme [Nitrosospira multiformis]PTQ77071.1 glyoxalase/bleomycin resistance protein/dioxygenase superfamily protein [Nitrosospira multiformis]